MIARLTLVLGIVPLCSYGRVQRLQAVASSSSHPSTEWTACLAFARTIIRHCRPAVLQTRRALVAEPEDLLVAVQAGVVGEVPIGCVAFVVPFC